MEKTIDLDIYSPGFKFRPGLLLVATLGKAIPPP